MTEKYVLSKLKFKVCPFHVTRHSKHSLQVAADRLISVFNVFL